MNKAINRFNKIFDGFITAIFLIDIVMVIIQVFVRFVLKASVPFTEELSRYLLVSFGMLGLAVCARKGDHLGAYFLRDKSKKLQPYIFIFNSLFNLIVCAILAYGGYKMIILSGDKVASTMPWFSLSYLYIAFEIGIILSALYAVRDLKNTFQIIKGEKEIAHGLSSPTVED